MKTETAVTALAALAQERRLAVYRLLVQQGPSGMAAGEIAAAVDTSPATLSFHLKELTYAGLVSSRQEGRFVYYAASFDAMNALIAFLTENCCAADRSPSCAPMVACRPMNVVRNPRTAARAKKTRA
jgi:DNA-binding transcriptional ArsR family regulator